MADKNPGTEVATTAKPQKSLIVNMAAAAGMEPAAYKNTLTQTVFKGCQNDAQLAALLMVANRYGLDPVTKEIMAFPDKGGGVVPIVGYDGWNRIAQDHPQYDGVELRYSDDTVVPDGGKECPEWIEVVVYRKDRSHPTVVREYLDECYRKTGPWQSHTKRMLRHKAIIQGYRAAFGFGGIYDEDEAQVIITEGEMPVAATSPAAPKTNATRAMKALEAQRKSSEERTAASGAPVAPQGVADDDIIDVVAEEEPGVMVEVDENGEVIAQQPEGALEAVAPSSGDASLTATQVSALNAAARNWPAERLDSLLAKFGDGTIEGVNPDVALDCIRILMAGPSTEQGALDV